MIFKKNNMISNSRKVLHCIKRHQGDFVKMLLQDQVRQKQLLASKYRNPGMSLHRIPGGQKKIYQPRKGQGQPPGQFDISLNSELTTSNL